MQDEDRAEDDLPPVAWAFWTGWRGPPELVIHIARRARWAVGSTDAERATAQCTMNVHVKADVEPVQHCDAFGTEVTDDALRNFSLIEIDVRGPRGRIQVHLARKAHPEMGPPRSGVLLAVSDAADAVDTREVVARAVERRVGRRPRYSGEAATVAEVRDAAGAAMPETVHGGLLRAASPLIPAVAFAASGVSEGTGFSARELWFFLTISVAAGIGWVLVVLLFPRVEVQAVTRAKRAADLAYKGVGAGLVTALIGVAVKLVFGGDAN